MSIPLPSPDRVMEVCPGTRDYTLIGKGGYKVVYKATVGPTNSKEAIKVAYIPFDPTEADGESIKEENTRRIFREIGLLQKCTSPALVKLGSIDPFETVIDGHSYVIYSEELIPGDHLRGDIQSDERPNVSDLIDLAVCLLTAIKDLKPLNAIHRDIKPENIMRTGDSERPFVLLDLGIAYVVGGTNITKDQSMVMGTRWYIAPEMLEPGFRDSLDYRADLYAAGLVIYEFATGENPFAFQGDRQHETLYRIMTVKPGPLNALRPDLPAKFCKTVDQLIKKLPSLRPANIDMSIKTMEGLK